MKLSIIVPLYNEETLIETVLESVLRVEYPDFLNSLEIVVVDDCSTDRSYSIVEVMAKRESRIRLFRHEFNQGKGAAVKTGAGYATGDVLLIQDADLELSPVDIPSMLRAKRELAIPFVNGSRYLPGVLRTQSSYKRYFFNKLFTNIASVFTDVYLTDVTCGYKLMDKALFERLDLREKRFGFEVELILKCARFQKNWIAEVPVHYYPRNKGEGKKLGNLDVIRIFKAILKYGLFRQ